VVSTRCGYHAGWWDFSGQQVRKGTPRLERARVLEKLKFEAEAGGIDSEIRRINLDYRSPPNMRSDQPLGLGDRASINDVVGLDIHGSTSSQIG
jgi:hypothetical protein